MSYMKKDFAVEGMHCDGCVRSVTKAVQQMPGVKHVVVSLPDKRATVDYDGAAVNPAEIIAAIVGAGFLAHVK